MEFCDSTPEAPQPVSQNNPNTGAIPDAPGRFATALLDSASDAIIGLDLDDKVVFWNAGAENFFGRSAKEARGHPFAFLTGEDGEKEQKILARAKSGERVDPFQSVWMGSNGQSVSVSISISSIKDAAGITVGTSKIIHATSESRPVQEPPREDELNFTNQLRGVQRLDSFGLLARAIAHDFNNMLAVIDGYSRLILHKENPSPKIAKHIGEVLKAAERAAALSQQLLSFSRKQTFDLQPADVGKIAQKSSKMLQYILGPDIALRMSFAPSLPLVRADRQGIEKVLNTLAFNARDALPEGGEVQIAATPFQSDETFAQNNPGAAVGEFVRLSFRDNGHGIPSENQPRIFEPFFTTRPEDPGAGLSLATAAGIIKQHRGWIQVASRPGEGTNVEVFLPVSQGESPKLQESRPSLDLNLEQRRTIGGSETILIVEAEHSLRQLMQHVLRSHGYKSLEAADAKQALAAWEAHKGEIDLLLTDVSLPGEVSGVDLFLRLQRLKPTLKSAFTSIHPVEKLTNRASIISDANTITKPFYTQQLVETIARACKEKPPIK